MKKCQQDLATELTDHIRNLLVNRLIKYFFFIFHKSYCHRLIQLCIKICVLYFHCLKQFFWYHCFWISRPSISAVIILHICCVLLISLQQAPSLTVITTSSISTFISHGFSCCLHIVFDIGDNVGPKSIMILGKSESLLQQTTLMTKTIVRSSPCFGALVVVNCLRINKSNHSYRFNV